MGIARALFAGAEVSAAEVVPEVSLEDFEVVSVVEVAVLEELGAEVVSVAEVELGAEVGVI